jgi:GTP-binding protein
MSDFSKWLFAQECKFVAGAATSMEQIPAGFSLPEIAFAGRSNVGKSSLINALTGRRTLVKVSQTPGRTQQLNFFNLADKLMLVDLPGYGYAKQSKAKVGAWNRLIRDYLRGRPNLRRVCLLIDSRHGLKPNDIEIMELLDESAVPYQIVYTKMDKTKEPPIPALSKPHAAMMKEVFHTSSSEKIGIDELRAELALLAQNNDISE